MKVINTAMYNQISPVVFLALWTCIVTAVCGLVEFSRSLNDQGKITTFQGVTIATCKTECESRKRCKSAVYYRRAHYCVLSKKPRDILTTILKPGGVLFGRDQPLDETELETCDGKTCLPNETCSAVDAGSRVCKITECKSLPSFYGTVLGNLYAIGNRIIAKRSPADMRVTCGVDGYWIPDESYDVIDCTDKFGSSGLYRNDRQQNIYCDMDTGDGHWLSWATIYSTYYFEDLFPIKVHDGNDDYLVERNVFQRRQDGPENFRRNWAEYRNGFGELTGEFWLGLETLHDILSYGEYELRVDMEDFDGVKRYAEYSTFSISSEADKYRLTATGYSGDVGDGLGYHNGVGFRTIDRDNGFSCATRYSAGWWFNRCHSANLNGKYYLNGGTMTKSQYPKYVSWLDVGNGYGNWILLKKTEMKFRRK